MKGKKGVILVLTVSAMLIFTLLGIATMDFAGFQGQGIVKKTSATEAFWIAEAGIQRALASLPGNLFNQGDTLANGNYTVNTALKSGYNHRWVITSTAHRTPVRKVIEVEAAPDIINAFQTTGNLKPRSDNQILPDGSYSVGRGNFTYTFSGLFGNLNAGSSGVQVLHNPLNNQNTLDDGTTPLQNGIIWVEGDFKVTSNWAYEGILIVNGDFEMTGGSFNGIVWINGASKMIEGNPGINGAVFVNDPKNDPDDGGQTKIDSTSAWVSYDALIIDQVYDKYLQGVTPPATYRHIVKWTEKE